MLGVVNDVDELIDEVDDDDELRRRLETDDEGVSHEAARAVNERRPEIEDDDDSPKPTMSSLSMLNVDCSFHHPLDPMKDQNGVEDDLPGIHASFWRSPFRRHAFYAILSDDFETKPEGSSVKSKIIW